MKKILSLLLALTMLFSVCVCGATTASAADNENLCTIFDGGLRSFISFYGLSPYGAYSVTMRTLSEVCNDPEKFEQTEGTLTFTVEKNYFNDLAEKLFQLDKSFEELLAEDSNASAYITVDGDKYVITIDARGGGRIYTVRGYVKEGDTYSVYFQPYLDENDVKTDLEWMKTTYKLSDKEAAACVATSVKGYEVVFFPSYYDVNKITVSYDGEYIKIIEAEKVDSIPALSEMIIPEKTEKYEIPAGTTSIKSGAFSGWSVIKSVVIPDSVKNIGEGAFSGCSALKSITLPGSVRSIGDYAFAGCGALKSIAIPDSVTSIGNGAFASCSALTIYGYSDSYAQTYANENSIPFAALYPVNESFTDVAMGAWYVSAVQYAVDNSLFFGTSPTEFAPNVMMNRAMLVTVLWRMEGEPTESAENPFTDVPSGEWYSDAVKWAAANGIVYGITNDKFDPKGDITREQMVAILHRYAEKKGYDVIKSEDLGAFPDGAKTSSYAKEALSWAYAEKLITGVKAGNIDYLDPKGGATRAQVASILMRYGQNVVNAE